MEEIFLSDALKLYSGKPRITKPLFVNVRGTNGAGKSTIPRKMIEQDPFSFEILYHTLKNNKLFPIATVAPSYNFCCVGSYRTKCGGLDTISSTDETRYVINTLWKLDFDLLAEGILASTVYKTYRGLFLEANRDNDRTVIIYSLLPPVETCIERIYERNGHKPIKEVLVHNKYRTVKNNCEKFKLDFISEGFDNSNVPIEGTISWFLGNIKPYREKI